MHEPKYRLNKKDRERFSALAVKEALDKITEAERVELKKLDQKRSRKLRAHPRMQEYFRHQAYNRRKAIRLCQKIDAIIEKNATLRRAFGKKRFMDAFKK
jgi:hypothetical protein